MDVFHFCWINLLAESKKSNVFFDKNTCNIKNANDAAFDKPVNRIAYLYKYGTFNISFFHKCVYEFVTNTPNAVKVIESLCSTKNMNICSVSTGPGTDIIGFLYALHQLGNPLTETVNFKIISKYGTWRNLATEMINSQVARISESSTCKLIQADILKDPLEAKAQNYLKNAEILLMFRPFSSVEATEKVIYRVLKDIFQLLKPGAMVFFISDHRKSVYFQELSSCGSFLYGPKEVQISNLPYDSKIVDLVGVQPLTNGSHSFAVWRKSEASVPETSISQQVSSEWKTMTSPDITQGFTQSLFDKVSEIEKNISKEDITEKQRCPEGISQGTSRLSSSICSGESHFQLNDGHSTVKSDVLLQEKDKEINTNNAANSFIPTSTSLPSCNSANGDVAKSMKSLFSKVVNVKCEFQQKKNDHATSMASLLKSLEGLVSKFDDFITQQGTVKQKDSTHSNLYCSNYQNSCCNKLYQGHCSMHCCIRNHRCSRCIEHCQSCDQSLTMCSNMNHFQHNCSSHDCRLQCASSASGCYPAEKQNSDPHLVIPLSNLREDTLKSLFLASQNNSN